MEASKGGGRPQSVSREGEWKLVWKPKLKPLPLQCTKSPNMETPLGTSSGVRKSSGVRRNWGPGSGPNHVQTRKKSPMRASTLDPNRPPYGDGMTGILSTASLRMGIPGLTPPSQRSSSAQGFVRPNSKLGDSATARSGHPHSIKPLCIPSKKTDIEIIEGSEASNSARSRLSTMSQQSLAHRKRLGTGRSVLSQRSVSSMTSYLSGNGSAYSDFTSVSQQDEIIKRIKGLEEALNAERTLRMKMQEMIQTKLPTHSENSSG